MINFLKNLFNESQITGREEKGYWLANQDAAIIFPRDGKVTLSIPVGNDFDAEVPPNTLLATAVMTYMTDERMHEALDQLFTLADELNNEDQRTKLTEE